MIDFKKELQKYKPIEDADKIEDVETIAVIKDIIDLLTNQDDKTNS